MKLSHNNSCKGPVQRQLKIIRDDFQILNDERGISQRKWVSEYRSRIVFFTTVETREVSTELRTASSRELQKKNESK